MIRTYFITMLAMAVSATTSVALAEDTPFGFPLLDDETEIVEAMTNGYDRDELADLKRRMDEISAILKGMAA